MFFPGFNFDEISDVLTVPEPACSAIRSPLRYAVNRSSAETHSIPFGEPLSAVISNVLRNYRFATGASIVGSLSGFQIQWAHFGLSGPSESANVAHSGCGANICHSYFSNRFFPRPSCPDPG